MTIERTTVHVSDDTDRIAMLEKRIIGTDDSAETLVRYIYSNHLQSASLELDGSANIISYEEYHPYGTTAFQAKNSSINAVAKRYRYTGKERDEESGLYYHGARYYIPWLARWVSVDPINNENYNLAKGYGLEKNLERDFLELCASPYEYAYDNPINYTDATGEQPKRDNVIAKISTVKSLNSRQMVDALKLARDEVASRLNKDVQYEPGQISSIQSLSDRIRTYTKSHKLSSQQLLDFHKTTNQYYYGLSTVATYSPQNFNKLDRAVINNQKISDYQKLEISAKYMIESYVNLFAFMKITADVAMLPAIEGVMPISPPARTSKFPRTTSELTQRIINSQKRGYEIVPTKMAYDKGAHELAAEIGGQPQVAFRRDPNREYDAISATFIGQHKTSMKRVKADFRDQAKRTFEDAKATNRGVIYKFDEKPGEEVIRKLNEYSNRYKVPLIIK